MAEEGDAPLIGSSNFYYHKIICMIAIMLQTNIVWTCRQATAKDWHYPKSNPLRPTSDVANLHEYGNLEGDQVNYDNSILNFLKGLQDFSQSKVIKVEDHECLKEK